MDLGKALLQTFSFVLGLSAVIALFFWVSIVFRIGNPAMSEFLPFPVVTLLLIFIFLAVAAWRVSPEVESTLKGVIEALLEALNEVR